MLLEMAEPNFDFDNEGRHLSQLVLGGWNQVNVIISAVKKYMELREIKIQL